MPGPAPTGQHAGSFLLSPTTAWLRSPGVDILRVGGGLSANGTLLQAVADLSGQALEVAADLESTVRGVATLAAEAVGLLDGDAGTPGIARRVEPRLESGGRARERSRWHEALEVHVRTAT